MQSIILHLSKEESTPDSFIEANKSVLGEVHKIINIDVKPNYYLAHTLAVRNAVREAKNAGLKYILITTDQAQFTPDAGTKLSDMEQFINHMDISMVYLGGVKWTAGYEANLIDLGIVKLVSGVTAPTAFIITDKYYDIILTEVPGVYEELEKWKFPAFDQWAVTKFRTVNVLGFEPRIEISQQGNNTNIPAFTRNDREKYDIMRKFCNQGQRERCYVIFTEMRHYLLWQTELAVYSLIHNAGINPKDIIILYTGTAPEKNPKTEPHYNYFKRNIIDKYKVNEYKVSNYGKMPWSYRVNNDGISTYMYAGMNKWTSLIEAAVEGVFKTWDNVMLLEQDLWFADKLEALPAGNVGTANWINNKDEAFKSDKFTGINLVDFLKFCRVPEENIEKWQSTAIIYNFTKETIENKEFLRMVVHYTNMLIAYAEIVHPEGARWETDMIAPSLALAHCGIDITSIDSPSYKSSTWTEDKEAPDNVVVHYGWDFAKNPHLGVDFSKFAFANGVAPWENESVVNTWIFKSKFNWMKKFFGDMLAVSKNSK